MGLGNDGSMDDGRIWLPIWLHVGILACGANSWIDRNSRRDNASNASRKAHDLGNFGVDFFDSQLRGHGRILRRRTVWNSRRSASPKLEINKNYTGNSRDYSVGSWNCNCQQLIRKRILKNVFAPDAQVTQEKASCSVRREKAPNL